MTALQIIAAVLVCSTGAMLVLLKLAPFGEETPDGFVREERE